jgi:hypothetical protein
VEEMKRLHKWRSCGDKECSRGCEKMIVVKEGGGVEDDVGALHDMEG